MKNLQTISDEIKNSTPENLQNLQNLQAELKEYHNLHQEAVKFLIEKVVYEEIKKSYVKLKSIQILPSYIKNNGIYSFNNVMITFDCDVASTDYYAQDISKGRLQQNIDNELGHLVSMLKNDFEINIQKLQDNFGIFKGNKKSKIFSNLTKC